MIAKCPGCKNQSPSCGLFQEENCGLLLKTDRIKDLRVFTECKLKDPKQCEGVCTTCGTRRTFDRSAILG